jgi:hypothetical protein
MDEQKGKGIPLDDEKIKNLTDKLTKTGEATLQKTNEVFSNAPQGEATEKTSPKEQAVIKNLRTYQGDVAEIIQRKNTSVVSVALAEKKREETRKEESIKRGEPQIEDQNHSRKNALLVVLSITLILLGVSAIVGFYFLQKDSPLPEEVTETSQSIIAFNEKRSLNTQSLTREKILETIYQERAQWQGAPNNVLYFEFTNNEGLSLRSFSSQDFLSIMRSGAPASLSRSFGNQFMVGMMKRTTAETFILFDVEVFENAFDGMLRWENTLYSSLGSLFSKNIVPIFPLNTATSSSPTIITSNAAEVPGEFEDVTIKNKDARVLRNARGEIILLYSFLDQNTLLLTSNIDVFREMIDRVLGSRFTR